MDARIPHIKLPNSKLPEELPKGFKPSPTMRIYIGNGKSITMNRRERRRRGLYGNRLTVRKERPNPPAIYHSKEEMEDSLRR